MLGLQPCAATSPSYKDFSSEVISMPLVFSWSDFSSILLISGRRYSQMGPPCPQGRVRKDSFSGEIRQHCPEKQKLTWVRAPPSPFKKAQSCTQCPGASNTRVGPGPRRSMWHVMRRFLNQRSIVSTERNLEGRLTPAPSPTSGS